jgi:hypothetical protein
VIVEQHCDRHSRTYYNGCFECSMEERLTELRGEPVRIASVRFPARETND